MEKKLRKSRTDKKLCGVCGGLAKYFECDATMVRLATVVLTFCWGAGLLFYLAAALVMPFEEGTI